MCLQSGEKRNRFPNDAAITLATGERKDLSGFHVVFMSNIGAAEAVRMQSAPFASIERTVLARVGQQLRPELVGRMTEKIVFNRLPYAVQREICEHMVAHEQTRLRGLGHAVDVIPRTSSVYCVRATPRRLEPAPCGLPLSGICRVWYQDGFWMGKI